MAYSVAHRLWRLLPQKLRRWGFHVLTTVTAPRPDKVATGGLPIGIVGAFRSASGLGEGARLAYDALDKAGLRPSAFDLSAALDQMELPNLSNLAPLTVGTGGSVMIHINAPYFAYALNKLGSAQLRGRRVIGYWAWELERLPVNWNSAFQFVHEIWVPSSFTKSAVMAATALPVHVLGHPLAPPRIVPFSRDELAIAPGDLMTLTVFHLGSAFSRKNPLAAVAAFRKAFGNANDKALVIKLVDPGGASWARRQLTEAIADARNIHVIDRMLSTEEMAGLMAAADIVISLHRAEGFGLVPAQAMQLGKPVVATGWSGNLDFMNEANAALVSYKLVPVKDPEGTFDMPDQRWADADIDHAAEWLKRLAGNAALRAELGAAAAIDIRKELGPEHYAERTLRLLGGLR